MKKYYNLEDVCEILDSKRVPITSTERVSGEYPYYGANGLQDYVNDYIFDDELVLLAEDGGNFGSKDKPIAYRVSGKCWVNNHAHVLKAKNDINVDYLCYSLMFYDTTGIVNGATRQKLTQASMRKMKIPLVSMSEQLKIVKKLDTITHILNKSKQKIVTLDNLVKSQFNELFGDIENPKYPLTTFGDICSVRQGLQIAISNRKKEPADNRLKYITIQYLHGGKNPEYIENPRESVVCNENDILMTRTGNTGMVVTNVRGVFHNNFFLIDFNRDKFTKDYLVNYLNLPTIQAEILKRAGTSTIPDLNHGQFYQIRLIEPPIELQNQFADFVKHIDKLKFSIKKSIEKLEICYKSLMQEYFG